MYGEFELAEQAVGDRQRLRGRKSTAPQLTLLEIRGVNMFLTVQDIDQPHGAFWSDRVLDDLPRHRRSRPLQLLDIHRPCDAVTLTSPTASHISLTLPDFPSVGVGP